MTVKTISKGWPLVKGMSRIFSSEPQVSFSKELKTTLSQPVKRGLKCRAMSLDSDSAQRRLMAKLQDTCERLWVRDGSRRRKPCSYGGIVNDGWHSRVTFLSIPVHVFMSRALNADRHPLPQASINRPHIGNRLQSAHKWFDERPDFRQ